MSKLLHDGYTITVKSTGLHFRHSRCGAVPDGCSIGAIGGRKVGREEGRGRLVNGDLLRNRRWSSRPHSLSDSLTLPLLTWPQP